VAAPLGGEDGAIGRAVRLSQPGAPAASTLDRRTVVGVLAPDFRFPGETPDVLVPLGVQAYNLSFPTNRFLRAIGRLAPGTSVAAARDAAEPIVRESEPADRRTARLVTLRDERIGIGARPLWLMLAGAALLLVVACANVAGLMLGDARLRQQETAVRLALGGSRWRVLRELSVEHAMLASLAGAAGLVLAYWLVPFLISLAPAGLVGTQAVGIDSRLALWSIAAAFVTTMAAGLIPGAALASTLPGDALKRGGRETTRGGRWRHRAVVAAQFSLALVLMVAAGLFGETLLRLGARPLRFTPDGVAVATVVRDRHAPQAPAAAADREKYAELRRTDTTALSLWMDQRAWTGTHALLGRLRALPGATAVAAATSAPFMPLTDGSARLRADDQPTGAEQDVRMHVVSEEYFRRHRIAPDPRPHAGGR
jgi:hypothetical protein